MLYSFTKFTHVNGLLHSIAGGMIRKKTFYLLKWNQSNRLSEKAEMGKLGFDFKQNAYWHRKMTSIIRELNREVGREIMVCFITDIIKTEITNHKRYVFPVLLYNNSKRLLSFSPFFWSQDNEWGFSKLTLREEYFNERLTNHIISFFFF